LSPTKSLTDQPTLCVINYNGEAFLRDTLTAAHSQARLFAEILVIDNGSEDGSIALIEREFPSVRVVPVGVNRGPAAARNVGLAVARTDLIVFVDNDVTLADSAVERLLSALADNPGACIATPRVVYAWNRDLIQFDGADNHFLGLQRLRNPDRPVTEADDPANGECGGNGHVVRSLGSLITACFLVDRSRLPAGEVFDEDFFIYVEDHDYGLRVRALGRDMVAVTCAVCYHAEGTKNLSIRSLGTYSSRRVFCLIRNRWQLLVKNYALRTLLVLLPLLVFYELAQVAVAVKKGWFREWARAMGWFFAHLPATLAERRRIQRARKVPDRALLIGGPIPFRRELTTSRLELAARRLLDAFAVAYWKVAERLI
jgi:hypothetical protein